MQVQVTVRAAQEADRAAVGRLLALGFADKFQPLFGADLHRNAAVLAELPSPGVVYVAEHAGEVVGTFSLVLDDRPLPSPWRVLRRHLGVARALWAWVLLELAGRGRPDPDTALVEAVAVLPEWRGRGVGRQMMERALAEAARGGRRRVGLYVVEGNTPAVRLYTSLGFRVQRVHHPSWTRPAAGGRRVLYMVAELAVLGRG